MCVIAGPRDTYFLFMFSLTNLLPQGRPETIKLDGPNPFDEEEQSNTELASVAYRCSSVLTYVSTTCLVNKVIVHTAVQPTWEGLQSRMIYATLLYLEASFIQHWFIQKPH